MEEPQDKRNRFIGSPITRGRGQAHAEVTLDRRHQGWRGVPHGGILMALALELVHHGFGEDLFAPGNFPIQASFRWGGPAVPLEEPLTVSARREDPSGQVVEIGRGVNGPPSFTARIRSDHGAGNPDADWLDRLAEAVEGIGRETRGCVHPLPSARECFVCGTERKDPGLARRFYCLDAGNMQIVFTSIGVDPDDQGLLARFRLDRAQVHPGVLAAVLDETMGWSGFLRARQGGMTVKLDVDFLRPVEPGEKMVCFGACSGIRGRTATRMFWFAEGGIVSMGEPDRSPILKATGQWLAVPSLTQEMRELLRPSAWLDRWLVREGA